MPRGPIDERGRIVQVDTPLQVYDNPSEKFVGDFVGTPPMNFVKGKVQGANGRAAISVGGQTLRASLPASVQTGRDVLLGIRAENVQASTEPVPDAVSARVLVVEPLGSHLLLTVDVGGESLKVNTRADFPVAPDQTVYLKLEPDKIRWFDPQSGKPVAEPA